MKSAFEIFSKSPARLPRSAERIEGEILTLRVVEPFLFDDSVELFSGNAIDEIGQDLLHALSMPKGIIEGKRKRSVDTEGVGEFGCTFCCVSALDDHMRLVLVLLQAGALGESMAKGTVSRM